jgi:SpoVK/Ycf46/Vps4 family AAA+-type ATPase
MDKYNSDGNGAREEAFQLKAIARRVEPRASWEDLTLPHARLSQLKDICNQARERHRISREWDSDRKLSPGKGLSILFSGPSGSGKTMAAEAIASDLDMPLFRIDLGAVLSKYIGETEKNLSRLLASAETSEAVLLFDEADSLFGKRTEVSDAHDRYANIETAYLLQKMEEFTGIAILATNLRQNLDEAFIRRMRFDVEFPSPADKRRGKLWNLVWRWFRRILRSA